MEGKIRSRISKSFNSNKFQLFAVFLIVAFILLVLTKFSKTYTERIILEVDYKNLPDDVAITLDKPSKLSADVQTVGFRIFTYYFKDKTIRIDLEKDVILGDSTYIYVPTVNDRSITSRLGSEVDIISVRPDSIVIPFSKLNTKRVPIKIDAEIELSSGYDYKDRLKTNPDSISIIGPASVLNEIDHIKTEYISKEDVSSSFSQDVALVTPDNYNIKLREDIVSLDVRITKFTEGTVQVPVTIKNLPKNLKINFFPKTVPVSYYVSLNNYNDINASDFEVICDYNSVKDSKKSFFVPTLGSTSELVRSAKIRQEKIEFITTK